MEQGQEFWRSILKEEVKGIASSKCLKEVMVAVSAVVRPQETGRADITTAQVGESTEEDKNLARGRNPKQRPDSTTLDEKCQTFLRPGVHGAANPRPMKCHKTNYQFMA